MSSTNVHCPKQNFDLLSVVRQSSNPKQISMQNKLNCEKSVKVPYTL